MAKNKHYYDHTPTPENPMVRYGQFRKPVRGKLPPPEFMRDDGTDNLKSLDEEPDERAT